MFSANGMLYLFIFCVLFVEAAGKMAREEGKHDLGSAPEDSFPDNLSVPPTTAELVSNPHSSRSERGPRGDLALPKHYRLLFIMWKYEQAGMQPNCIAFIPGITHNMH